MKVVICGAGQVGSTIARQLAREGMHVTVIDADPDQVRRVDESYEVRGILGHASHPRILERAGADDADLLIAVTRSDEVNMVSCQVAYSLFNVKRRIARLRHTGYITPVREGLYAAEHLPIDVIIAPELEIAESIFRRLKTPGSFDMQTLGDGRLQLIGVHCDEGAEIIGERYLELYKRSPFDGAAFLVLFRDGVAQFPTMQETVRADDDVYVVVPSDRTKEVLHCFGHREHAARKLTIVGGGNVGLHLARKLAREAPEVAVRMIEFGKERAEYIARELGEAAIVLHGDALESEVLEDAQVGAAETIIAVTDDDETNIFVSVLARRLGCPRAITLVNKRSYEPLLPALGLYTVVSPSATTISTVLRHVRSEAVHALHTLRGDFGEVVEVTLGEKSPLAQRVLRDVNIPAGILLGPVLRDDELIIPRPETQLAAGDRVVAVVEYYALKRAETLFAGRKGLLG